MTFASRLGAGFAIAVAGMGFGGCALVKNSAAVKYQITVSIGDDDQAAEGSAIWSWGLSKPMGALGSPYNGSFKGEAFPIELSDGRTVFAILRGVGGELDMPSLMPERMFGDIGRAFRGEDPLHGTDRVADLKQIASRVGEAREIPCDEHPAWCPMLVEFEDQARAESVRRFDPTKEGKSFKVIITITNAEPTRGVMTRLGWLENYRDRMFSGSLIRTAGDLAAQLSAADFVRGF